MDNKKTNIILFDGVCNLCNSTVRFIIRHDPKTKFRFASLQSESGQLHLRLIGLPPESFYSLIYMRNNKYYIKSTAVILILHDLGRAWKLFFSLIVIPRFLRDMVYDFVAKHRYRYFGKSESCMIPSPENQRRFVE